MQYGILFIGSVAEVAALLAQHGGGTIQTAGPVAVAPPGMAPPQQPAPPPPGMMAPPPGMQPPPPQAPQAPPPPQQQTPQQPQPQPYHQAMLAAASQWATQHGGPEAIQKVLRYGRVGTGQHLLEADANQSEWLRQYFVSGAAPPNA